MLPFLRTASLRRGSTFVARARTAKPIPHRNYGSMVHPGKYTSEMPWIIGSVAFTVPAVLYLMSGNSSSSDHSSHRVAHAPTSTVGETVESAKQSLSDAATKVSEKASEVTEFSKEKSSQVVESVKETAPEATFAVTPKRDVKEEAKETAEAAGETTGEAVEQAKEATGETVEQVKEKTGEEVEEVKETTSELTDSGKQSAGTAKEKASEASGKAEETASNLDEKAKEASHTLGERTKATIENIKDKVLPDDPEAPGAEKKPRTAAEHAILEENRKPYTDIAHSAQGADATSRKAGSSNTQSGKQEGISSGSTWHAGLHLGQGAEISKKAEGVHDSAKLKGTVDPKRTPSS